MAKDAGLKKPFDGAVSKFVAKKAAKKVRQLIEEAGKHEILDPSYPYQTRLDDEAYEKAYAACQLELVKLQTWFRATGQRIVLVFEGRDAAGKGGAIKAMTENLNPRTARVAALPAPSDVERGQWYFQRYVGHLPTSGEMVLFDRSWYNRAVSSTSSAGARRPSATRFFLQLPSSRRCWSRTASS